MNKFNVFKNKTVLVTGNSGFKGSWLSAWLLELGANVVGFSLDIPTKPSHFNAINLGERISQVWGDIRNLNECLSVLKNFQPDFIFHLAAQPIVKHSYVDPYNTFATNTVGTLNMLESIRLSNYPCVAVFITSDKCYDNIEQLWGYRENDRLGGKDPYSGSKGAAEMIIRSYVSSYFTTSSAVRVAVGRAGNVIGGGDWADDRVVPDAMRSWSNKSILHIRKPNATRPWQHVLEPLSGYLTLAADLMQNNSLNGQAFNFGPHADQNFSVSELLKQMQIHWRDSVWQEMPQENAVYEAGLLKLCCDKALHLIGWRPLLTFAENIELTANWYDVYYKNNENFWDLTQTQIAQYRALGVERSAIWAK